MSKADFNILFSCAGRRVALMQAFRSAMNDLSLCGKLLAADVTATAAAVQYADVGLTVPAVTDQGYCQALLDAVRRHAIKLLVPVTDLDLELLARRQGDFQDLGCTVMIGTAEAVRACRDKTRTNALLRKAGLAEVRALSLPDFEADPFYPCFVKPINGSAGIGSSLIESPGQLAAHVALFGRDMIVQEYLGGQEFTVDVCRSRDGTIRSVVPRQRLAVRSGEVEKALTVNDPSLIASATRLAEAVEGLWGVFCCQCRRDNPQAAPRFFEINPRFGGGVPLAIAAGANLPLYLLQDILGKPVSADAAEFTDGLLMLRYDAALYVRADRPQSLPGFDEPEFR